MAVNFMRTLFGKRAKELQTADGSRQAYQNMVDRGPEGRDLLTAREAEFLAQRDSFYIASVTEDGWPYVQHRGGPKGFLKLLDQHRLAFADFGGNRQHLSAANIDDVGRVSLFLMDYPNRRRLKLIGEARWEVASPDHELWEALVDPDYKADPQRFFVIDVVGYDWNCPQHITPRFTADEWTEFSVQA
jgi:hypothetical protein